MKKSGVLFMLLLLSACMQDNALDKVVWQTFDNKNVKLTEHKGKWVIVNYWATWCTPCIKEMPVLQNFHHQNQGSVVVIGANVEYSDGFVSEERILNFVEQLKLSFPIVKANIELDKTSLVKIKVLPTTVIINPEGEISYTHFGEISQEKLMQLTQ